MTQTADEKRILDAANQCVKCGVCMPHCPTYQETLDENESPRGRIALMQGLMKHDLPLSEKLQGHLDHCLSCMACEAVCPSHVVYSGLIDDTKTFITERESKWQRFKTKWLLNLLSQRRIQYLLHFFSYAYQKSGLQTCLRRTGLLKHLRLETIESVLPKLKAPHVFRPFYAAKGDKQGQVGLFLGCLNPAFDTQTVEDAIAVLTHLGFDVLIPKAQTCCGAMHLHNGFKKESAQYEAQNNAAFPDGLKGILMLGSGCAATTLQYDSRHPYQEICEFIAPYLKKGTLKTHATACYVHLPCTQKNILKQKNMAFMLLKQIPDMQVHPFSSETHCCGAAGTYMIRYPEMAKNLFLDLWEKRSKEKIQIIVSNNIGCSLHFLAQLKNIDETIQVVHPISMIWRALQTCDRSER